MSETFEAAMQRFGRGREYQTARRTIERAAQNYKRLIPVGVPTWLPLPRYMSLHATDPWDPTPGATNLQTTNEAAYAGYERIPIILEVLRLLDDEKATKVRQLDLRVAPSQFPIKFPRGTGELESFTLCYWVGFGDELIGDGKLDAIFLLKPRIMTGEGITPEILAPRNMSLHDDGSARPAQSAEHDARKAK